MRTVVVNGALFCCAAFIYRVENDIFAAIRCNLHSV